MNKRTLSLTLLSLVLSAATAFAGNLDGKWRLDYWPQGREAVLSPADMAGVKFSTVEATVPGNVELDLYDAGLVPQPETGANYELLRPYEGYQWRYSRTFRTPAFGKEDSVILKFDGIDTFAEIYVNGKHVGSADNMLIEHSFDVTDFVKPAGSSNTLEVYIRSSVIEGRKQLPPTFSNNWQRPETVFMRRAPHTYGWDIMPRIVSAGIWKGVDLKVVAPVHFEDVVWYTGRVDAANRSANMMVDYMVSLPPKYQQDCVDVHVKLSRNGKVAFERTAHIAMYSERVRIHVEDIDLWWPRGYGEAALYDGLVELVSTKDGSIIDSNLQKVGIRTIQLERTGVNTRENPGKFCFIVNGEPIFVHGSNWTPMDAFHSRDPQWLEKTMDLVTDLNCNMLRCWGGNVYESDEFYDLCSEAGVMIWQDFSMGCSFYPQSTAFQLKLEEELYAVVKRLRRHTCVALWAGNNEDDAVITDGNFNLYEPDPNRDVVTRVTIPNVLFDMDPTRPYLPSSPYWDPLLVQTCYGGLDSPERHIWGPRGYYKDKFYTEDVFCEFASEIGYHGMPNRESLEKMFPAESVYPWEEGSEFRWKEDWLYKSVREYSEWGYCPDRNNLMINQIHCLFGDVPTDLDEFIFASQIVQAEAMKYFVENFRGHKFNPMTGILWWNIRDGFPIISDAVVDWYFSPKRAYYYLKNSQNDVCAIILDPVKKNRCPLVVTNDTLEPASGEIMVIDKASGKVVYKGSYSVPSNGHKVIARLRNFKGQGLYEIHYTVGSEEHMNHYLYGTAPFKLDDYREWTKDLTYYKAE